MELDSRQSRFPVPSSAEDPTTGGPTEPGVPMNLTAEATEDPQSNTQQYRYARSLGNRVRSFETDPLHSSAYLAYLAKYLKSPFRKQPRRPYPDSTRQSKARGTFVQRYLLPPKKSPVREPFQDVNAFEAVPVPDENEILFLEGRPSAEWLNAIGSKYELDQRFFHQHLGPILSNQKQWYTLPALPSRSLEVFRLCIPTIIFVGPEGRNVDVLGLELARDDCVKQLQRTFRSVQDSFSPEPGRSIIRRINIHNGSQIVLEQELTITIIRRGCHFTALLWTDAGDEAHHEDIPVPTTGKFKGSLDQMSFCPVFFENQLTENQCPLKTSSSDVTAAFQQPLALLNSNYGATIEWSKLQSYSPISVLQELFTFEAASYSQYINMLEQTLSDATDRDQFPSYEHSKLETILHFDYAKIVLTRCEVHFEEMLLFLKNPPEAWQGQRRSTDPIDEGKITSAIQIDFEYLLSRVKRLVSACEARKNTLLGNASMQDAKRSAEEAKLVTRLTKATNRLTFIFLPISFVTSVFGMNFSQFGQGPLSIWLWAVITIPLLMVCVVIVEKGDWVKGIFVSRYYTKGQKKL
ncbi:MAG: hypothetical protein Q9160_000972 [Pyrenula sp. 1 TL-2023]